MTLNDYASGETLEVTHAVASGKARVALAKLASEAEKVDERTETLTEAVLKSSGGDQQAIIKGMLEAGTITIGEVLAMSQIDVAAVERSQAFLYKMFRVAVDDRQLSTEWKSRIASDDWMSDQDVKEVEGFVASFRAAVGV